MSDESARGSVATPLGATGIATPKPSRTFAENGNRGAEMIRTRMSKTGWERTDWVLCLAFSVMTAFIGLPAVAPGAASAAASAGRTEVKIDNFSFSPETLTVKAGTQITWTNGDDIPHTVVSEGQAFKSKVLGTGEKFTFTVSKPGTYSYSCSIHPNMTGKVVVE
jgi:plastocyanin